MTEQSQMMDMVNTCAECGKGIADGLWLCDDCDDVKEVHSFHRGNYQRIDVYEHKNRKFTFAVFEPDNYGDAEEDWISDSGSSDEYDTLEAARKDAMQFLYWSENAGWDGDWGWNPDWDDEYDNA